MVLGLALGLALGMQGFLDTYISLLVTQNACAGR